MLILSRKKEESLILNGNIEVKILEVSNGQVKIGIIAPKNVEVHRKEVYERILEENTASSKGVKSFKQFIEGQKKPK